MLCNKIAVKPSEIRIRNGNFVEYFDLDISKLKDNFIEKVTLGPKCTVEKDDIELLLERNGYKNVEVQWSEGSYR